MKNEIDKDFYCSAGYFNKSVKACNALEVFPPECTSTSFCKNRHRKHPTPEEYKNEYGEEVPVDMPVWARRVDVTNGWALGIWGNVRMGVYDFVVCACTPFGKPDDNWRPK